MTTELLYLRPNVQVEPLFDCWYACSHLISPATAARNITERHLKIMESYISAPQVHAAAVKNPKMLGGPFIDYDGERVEEIAALRDRTKKERADLIEFSAAVSALDTLLRVNAKGFSLQPLYAKVPALLRGYVELVYDLNNNASFRLIEPLLYRSKYYQRSAQSLRLSIISGDSRPFVLSTPRLQSKDSIDIPIAFDDELVDWIFRLKRSAAPWREIRERLNVSESEQSLLHSMFTVDPPAPYQPYNGSGVRWRYFGHACILIETAHTKILLDPVLSYTYETDISRYTYDDLPDEIDFVLITHNHQDHILFETLLQIRHKVKTFIVPKNAAGSLQDPSVKLMLQNAGCKNVIELQDMESVTNEDCSITGTPFIGEHADLDIKSKLGYLVRFGKLSLLFLADSCNLEPALYEHVHRETGDADVLFLGMECNGAPLSWLYGPLLTRHIERTMDSSRRLAGSDYRQAIDIVDRFHCKETYVYAMGQEPWLNYVMSIKYTEQSRPIIESDRLIQECNGRGIAAERLFGEREILVEKGAGFGGCIPT
jgi:L-ascorbate metabolism protein UlaG (beta-lactamase superfamily)